jgi:hypothetical protein
VERTRFAEYPTTAYDQPGRPQSTARLNEPAVSPPPWFLVSTYTPFELRCPPAV